MKNQDSKALREIQREFSRRRRVKPGLRLTPVPSTLRRLALSALKRGHAPSEVAVAAGISRQSLANWERQAGKAARLERPVRLKLVEERVSAAAAPKMPESGAMARVALRSGVTVELPVSSLEPKWLLALGGGAL